MFKFLPNEEIRKFDATQLIYRVNKHGALKRTGFLYRLIDVRK